MAVKNSARALRTVAGALAGMLWLAGPALGSEAATTTPDAFSLGVIVVTATRLPAGDLPQEQVGSLITSSEMRQFNRETVGDAVNLLPGVTLSNNLRNEQLVYVRGFDARQVPLFIDGVPVYVPYDGYVDFNRFGTYDVAAIQVAKGFSSIAYGPNALGGAINVVSRKPTQALEGDAVVGVGDGSASQAGINLGTQQGRWYAQGGASYREADSFPMSSDFKPTATEDGGLRNNADRRDSKLSLKFGLTPNATDEYALSYYKQDGSKGQPPSTDPASARYWRWPYWDKESLYFISSTALGPSETVQLRLYHDQFDNEVRSYTDATYTTLKTSGRGSVSTGRSIYHDRTTGGAVELVSTRFASQTLRAVVQQKQDQHEERDANATLNARYQDTLRSFGVEDLLALGERWQLSVGAARNELRPDSVFSTSSAYDLPDTTSATNLQSGIFFDLTPSHRLYVTVADKTRLPTLKDRYSQRLGNYIENPTLGPETALNMDVGYQGHPTAEISVEAAAFQSRIDDKIQSMFVDGGTSCSPSTPCQMRNIGQAKVSGLELSVRAAAASWLDLGGNFTMLDQKNVSNPDIRLTGVPDRKLFAYAAVHPLEALDLQVTVENDSSRWVSNTVELAGFTIAGLKATFRPLKNLSIEAGVDNIADRNYELDAGFPSAGRSWFANVRCDL